MTGPSHKSLARRRVFVALLAALCAVSAACGTRVERDTASAPSPAGPSSDQMRFSGDQQAAPQPEVTQTPADAAPQAHTGLTVPPAQTRASGSAASTGRATAKTPTEQSAAGQTSSQSPKAASAPTAKTPPSTKPPAAGSAVPLPPGGKLSDVIVASVGTYSGPVGSVTEPILRGAQLWVKFINANGGLNGHQVKLAVFDDGGDPARHRSQVQEAIERLKAIAFLMNADGTAGEGSVDFINQKRIPVIGTELAGTWAYQSPMYFPQATAADHLTFTAIASAAQILLPKGLKKFGSLTCSEIQFCEAGHRMVADEAPGLGFEVAYRGRITIAQPDFTAECLAASRAGVQVLLVLTSPDGIGRIAAACARQNFRPNILILSSLIQGHQKDNPNLTGMVAPSTVFPWFQSNTPATAEFQDAIKRYGGGVLAGVGPATGWVAGKLLQRAAAKLPEPPTTAALLEGLWSIKGERLGDITQPLTFERDQNAKPVRCWYNLVLNKDGWATPDNYRFSCK